VAWEVAAMSVVTEHLERQGCAFQVIAHRQVYTSIDQARALGVDAGEVLKTLALRTAAGYALLVIPASRRLDLHLAREALGDHQARLASEEELADAFAGYQLGALPPLAGLVDAFAGYQLGALPPLAGLVDAEVYVDPEVLRHDVVAFAAGTQTESVRLRPGELFGGGQVTTVPLVRQPERGSEDPIGRRRAAQQGMADRGQPAS
jgi:prolyl-tRNA editing enzyme YbaK/EbsC (Cys-tRNA(Pro) deacylase)